MYTIDRQTIWQGERKEFCDQCHAGEVMLTRAVVETPPKSGKWKFSHDPRVHFLPHFGLSLDQIEFLAKAFKWVNEWPANLKATLYNPIWSVMIYVTYVLPLLLHRSNLLHIKADGGVNYLSDYMEANMQGWLTQDNNNLIRFTTVKDATHQVHLIEPEKVVQDIFNFIEDAHANWFRWNKIIINTNLQVIEMNNIYYLL